MFCPDLKVSQIWGKKTKHCKPTDHFRVICFSKSLQLISRLFLFLRVCLLFGFFEVIPMDLQHLHSALLRARVELADPTFAPFRGKKC